MKNALLLCVSLVISLAAVEGMLRLVPNIFALQQAYYSQIRDGGLPERLRYQMEPAGLYRLIPNQTGRTVGVCYDVSGQTSNAEGFRDIARPEGEEASLLVLGDSFVEGLQVEDEALFSRHLATLLGKDVFNAGISGYATYTQLAAFRRYFTDASPDLVIVAFYLGNDIKGNSCALDPGRAICGRLNDEGEIRVKRPVDSQAASDGGALQDGDEATEGEVASARPSGLAEVSFVDQVKGLLRRNLVLYHALYAIRLQLKGLVSAGRADVDPRWEIYIPDPSPPWEQAWLLTEDALERLKAAVEARGASLVVLGIPEPFVTSSDWWGDIQRGTGFAPPPGFDPDRPMARLSSIAEKLAIPMVDVTEPFRAYRDTHNLGFPYYSFHCDGHWNPLGHYLAAQVTSDFLIRQGLIAAPDGPPNAPQAPDKLLTQDALDALFGGGIYSGGGLNHRMGSASE